MRSLSHEAAINAGAQPGSRRTRPRAACSRCRRRQHAPPPRRAMRPRAFCRFHPALRSPHQSSAYMDATRSFGGYEVTREKAIEFAGKYDQRPAFDTRAPSPGSTISTSIRCCAACSACPRRRLWTEATRRSRNDGDSLNPYWRKAIEIPRKPEPGLTALPRGLHECATE